MSQIQRTREIEQYVKKLGELLNILYKKISDMESKVDSLESQLSGLSTEVVALRDRSMLSNEVSVSKQEYEQFTNSLAEALRSILPETQQEAETITPSQ